MRRVRVGEVLRLMRRPAEIDPFAEYVSMGVRSFGKGIFHYPPTLGSELSKLRFFEVSPEALVLSNIKAWEGAIGVSSEEDAGCVASNRFLTYVPIDGIDVRYAAWFFLSGQGLPLIQRASPGSADRNRTLAIDRFENLEIPLPDLSEQRRVVARLDAVRGRIARIASLTSRGDALADAARASLTRSDAPRFRIGEVVEQVRRPEPVIPERTYRLLGVRWYAAGLFLRETKVGLDVAASRVFGVEKGDFVYNRLFAWKGSFAIAGEAEDGCHVSNEFPTFRVDETRLDAGYLAAVFGQPRVWDDVLDRSSGGTPTSRNRLSEARFLDMRLPLPPLPEQRRIASSVAQVGTYVSRAAGQANLASGLAASALNQAFAGLP